MSNATKRLLLIAAIFFPACASEVADGALTKDDAREIGPAADGARDFCADYGWYGDMECDTFCPHPDPDCAARTPELGGDPTIVERSRVSMGAALDSIDSTHGPAIEAKFELDDQGALSLSVYPVANPITLDSERNVFEELAGDPTARSWQPSLEVFHDQEHLTRSSRDLTLVQLSRLTLRDAVRAGEESGRVYWAIPTIQASRAGYGLYTLDEDGESHYAFVDGEGSAVRQTRDLGAGPGARATDERTPELGGDVTLVRRSRISMSRALRQIATTDGEAIEAKFELDDAGQLSLSIYPVGHGVGTDAEQNTFFELAGDPTAATYAPSRSEFTVPDEEHLTRAARDLTIVQAARMTLLGAVQRAEGRVRNGIVFWAIPTIRDTRAGYGVYVLAPDNSVHYLFIS